MTHRNLLLSSMLAPAVLLAILGTGAGCNPQITNGTGTDNLELSANTIAISPSDLPSSGGQSGSSSVTTGGDPNPADPNALVVMLASSALSCAAPPATIFDLDPSQECPDTGGYLVRFTLAPEQQGVGVYPLQTLNGFFEEILPNGDGSCGFGGGTFWDGSVEVVAVDDATLEIKVSGTNSLSGDSVDGAYLVPRCSAPAADTPAIAIFRDDLPPIGGGGSSSVTSGGGGQPGDDLFLVVGSQSASCSDPFGRPSCDTGGGWSVSMVLPAAYQAVGVYDLSDPTLQGFFSVSDGTPECSGGGGTYAAGSLEVLSIDDVGVRIRLSGTGSVALVDATTADGTYNASRCN